MTLANSGPMTLANSPNHGPMILATDRQGANYRPCSDDE